MLCFFPNLSQTCPLCMKPLAMIGFNGSLWLCGTIRRQMGQRLTNLSTTAVASKSTKPEPAKCTINWYHIAVCTWNATVNYFSQCLLGSTMPRVFVVGLMNDIKELFHYSYLMTFPQCCSVVFPLTKSIIKVIV